MHNQHPVVVHLLLTVLSTDEIAVLAVLVTRSTAMQTEWNSVYTIQPVVKPVVKPDWQLVWQLVQCLYTRYNRLSIHDTTGCQTGWTTGCILYTNIQPFVCNRCMPVVQPVWQPAEYLFTWCSWLFNQLTNWLDNRLYHVNGVLINWVVVLRPTRHKMGHFYTFPSQSLGLEWKN